MSCCSACLAWGPLTPLVFIRFCTSTSLSNSMSTGMIKWKLMQWKIPFKRISLEFIFSAKNFLDLCCCNAPGLLSASWRWCFETLEDSPSAWDGGSGHAIELCLPEWGIRIILHLTFDPIFAQIWDEKTCLTKASFILSTLFLSRAFAALCSAIPAFLPPSPFPLPFQLPPLPSLPPSLPPSVHPPTSIHRECQVQANTLCTMDVTLQGYRKDLSKSKITQVRVY